jgi:hypothetical protein
MMPSIEVETRSAALLARLTQHAQTDVAALGYARPRAIFMSGETGAEHEMVVAVCDPLESRETIKSAIAAQGAKPGDLIACASMTKGACLISVLHVDVQHRAQAVAALGLPLLTRADGTRSLQNPFPDQIN